MATYRRYLGEYLSVVGHVHVPEEKMGDTQRDAWRTFKDATDALVVAFQARAVWDGQKSEPTVEREPDPLEEAFSQTKAIFAEATKVISRRATDFAVGVLTDLARTRGEKR